MIAEKKLALKSGKLDMYMCLRSIVLTVCRRSYDTVSEEKPEYWNEKKLTIT